MDNANNNGARKSGPTSTDAPARPNTPIPTTDSSQPPPLPSRPKSHGSNTTTYVAPPPPYTSNQSVNYQKSQQVPQVEGIPELIPADTNNGWGYDDKNFDGSASGWDYAPSTYWSNVGGYDSIDFLTDRGSTVESAVEINGRSYWEETRWWDSEEREKNQRPGPGHLPTVVAEHLHDSDHSLFSVSVTPPPTTQPPTAAEPTNSTGTTPSNTPSPANTVQQAPANPPNAPTIHPPTDSEVRTSVPHPNAYYCPKENGWVILCWKNSSIAPTLAKSFQQQPHRPLPDQGRRRLLHSCVEGSGPRANKTHHFHKYEKAVDSLRWTPPLRPDEWTAIDQVKQKRRGGTVILDPDNMDSMEIELVEPPNEAEVEGRLLDLYVCCQCPFYCVASGIIPGVIPRKYFDEFVRDKRANPPPGKSGEVSVNTAIEAVILAIENKLWKGENRNIRINGPGFQTRIGWNANVKRILDTLEFIEDTEAMELKPPSVDPSDPSGRITRRKLLRAWVEINAWLTDFRRINALHFKDKPPKALSVKIDPAREMYQTAIGAHPDQIPRNPANPAFQRTQDIWDGFGLTPTSYSPEYLTFAYLAQCRCDPAGTMKYFDLLTKAVTVLQEHGECPPILQELIVTEQSRNRFTTMDLLRAAAILGFGSEGPLKVDYEDDIPDDFIEGAWRDCVKRSWRNHEHGAEMQRDATEAFRILAEARGSAKLRRVWELNKDRLMNPSRAYDTLEIPSEVDDTMLLTIYNMRIEEQPLQMEKMREALAVIAEVRDSDRLRQFLEFGRDPGEIVPQTRPDFPRGLNQLGNTCYLNSLLQYFYTIRELREAVTPLSKLDESILGEKLTDDDLKRHRVGGRLVTRREIIRSKKFVGQLADLFFHLEYADAPAVTPTIELAKLALVTSRDEEEEEDKGGTDASNDTDVTLVDDPSVTVQLSPTGLQSPSGDTVLGKRTREANLNSMDVDGTGHNTTSNSASSSSLTVSDTQTEKSQQPQNTTSATYEADRDGDTKMKNESTVSKPPPLPPRKPPPHSDSVMMFGKQHDVSECMDNCMFQIETALLRFSGEEEAEGGGQSVVKRLFYGKIRQQLTGAEPSTRSSVHMKEDLFSHLPVNVANDGIDIYDGLSGYFDDVVEFQGKKHHMQVSLVELPPLLQIQLQRVQFNRETMQPYKSQAYVKFGETIYMDRFMDNTNPEKKLRSKQIQSELSTCRERLRTLVDGKDGSSFAIALEKSADYLPRIDGIDLPELDDDLILQLTEEHAIITEEIHNLRQRVDELKRDLEALWQSDTSVAYELTSVFIHRGSSPSWGHYFFYSRNLPNDPDSWFKYNDSDVSVVSKDEVLADTTGSTANPYLLVFARKGSNVVDTVKRFDPSKAELV
ncbi:hypothetical protein AX16_000402 [Volvariella volvacea WC 439]|nr:hypothetical protein AX16_000402 [Volvariella volvacea WC 439]